MSKRLTREEARINADSLKRAQANRARALKEDNARREEALKLALGNAKNNTILNEIEDAVAGIERFPVTWQRPPVRDRVFGPGYSRDKPPSESLVRLFRAVADKAPRLLDSGTDYRTRLTSIQRREQYWIRPLETWVPKGKSRDTQFRSLVEHLFAKYPVPTFFWSIFAEDWGATCPEVDVVVKVANGQSLNALVKDGSFRVPFTRKMCHDFMELRGDLSFVQAVRMIQVEAAGGSPRFLQAYLASRAGQSFHSRAEEEFWQTVIDWFCKNHMIDPAQVGPLCDYLSYKYQEGLNSRPVVNFSMKGRGAMALLRSMEEWHAGLPAAGKGRRGLDLTKFYEPSGIAQGRYEYERRRPDGNFISETYDIVEILSAKDLYEEGKAMSHCVYYYGASIEQKSTAIFALRYAEGPTYPNNARLATIEVSRPQRSVRQARGKMNRPLSAQELTVIAKWAGENKLVVQTYL